MREAARDRRRRLVTVSLCLAAGALTALLVGGCSGNKDDFYPVSGKVTAGGELIKKGSVSFRPDGSKGNKTLHAPTGDIGADGTYQLYTIGKPGAPPGWYKVIVFADANPNPRPGLEPKWLHHVKYTNEGSTDVLLEVVEKAPPGTYDLKLSR